jgi:hypothetical protein
MFRLAAIHSMANQAQSRVYAPEWVHIVFILTFDAVMLGVVGRTPCVEAIKEIHHLLPVATLPVQVDPAIAPALKVLHKIQSVLPVLPLDFDPKRFCLSLAGL